MKKKLWSQSVARRSLLGDKTETMNPSIAATSLLGRERVTRATKKLKTYRRRFHKNNPLPALLGTGLSFLGGLGGRFKKPSEVRAAALAPQIVQAANAGNLTAARGLIERAERPMIAKESAVWKAAAAQLAPNVVALVKKNLNAIPMADQKNPEAFAQSVMASAFQAPGAGAAAPPSQFSQLLTPQVVTGVARAVAPRRGRRGYGGRQRYPTYSDRYGRQRYSYKPPGSQMRIPEGATPAPGSPYSFFRGAVGRGGAATTAGQLAVAGAAGVAAYLVTQRLLQHLGGRAQGKEEAGVAAALAFRQARADFKQQQGRDPNRAELQEMKRAYQGQLVELGYDPVTFTRERSRVEEFLETYNPLGGE